MADVAHVEDRSDRAIWAPFRSLLLAQVLAAVLGLVFWVLVARLVDARDVGVAAAAISAQTMLGIVAVVGFTTTLIQELPLQQPARRRRMVMRSLLVVLVTSAVAGGALVAVSPFLSSNLRAALGEPVGAVTFVVGTVAFAWALVVDDACLAVQRSELQVLRNLVASSLRFPVTAALLALGYTDFHVLQICWVLPLLVSVPFTLWRLRLPRVTTGGPGLVEELRALLPLALRNHGLTLPLAAASQMVPLVAALVLSSVENAEFAIAWLMATFVFLPPYLLATALFAHGANVSAEEFRAGMGRTIPAALSLSLLLCVGAWTLGEPVLLIFGGRYSTHSWEILALLVPAGLWMVVKDHLVVLWRSQRRYALATRLASAALVIEIAGATIGGILGGSRGLALGWLVSMGAEMALGAPWLRQDLSGLRWQSPLAGLRRLRRRRDAARGRDESGRIAVTQVLVATVLVLAVGGVGLWTATRNPAASSAGAGRDDAGLPIIGSTLQTCQPTSEQPGPEIDLNVQSATGDPADPIRPRADVRRLVALAQDAGATVVSTTSSFRTMQPVADQPVRFESTDRTIAAARAAGLRVRLQLVGMPDWALDDPTELRQAPRSDAELDRWVAFVTAVMEHVAGQVDYLEVWNEPNDYKWWPTGPDPVEFARLLDRTYAAVKAVAPDTVVVSGGLASNDIGYLSEVYEGFETLGLTRTPFDMLGAHPFSGSAGPDDVDAARRYERDPFGLYDENFSGFVGLRKVLSDHGDDLPVYITQFGYSVRGGPDREAVPDSLRATYLTQAFEQATCATYVPVFSWYALHPTPWDPEEFTLVDRRLQPNLTFAALQAWGAEEAAARAGS